MNSADRRTRVEQVISILGLEKCASTRIGHEIGQGLSGGEKRRVSVAEELVVEPSILFLDEPTTGLDSSSSLSLCRALKTVAQKGTAVLLSIHQPREDIFNLFDHVIVLCEGGRAIFSGPTVDVPSFLRTVIDFGLAPPHMACPSTSPNPIRALPGDLEAALDPYAVLEVEEALIPQVSQTSRRLNLADLLLDVASCPMSRTLSDLVASGSFAPGHIIDGSRNGSGGFRRVGVTNSLPTPTKGGALGTVLPQEWHPEGSDLLGTTYLQR